MSSQVVDARTLGATGNGSTDDTAALQAAVEKVAGTGGTLAVPAGTYRIDAARGVRLRSRMTLRMAPGAVLKAAPNGLANYAVLSVRDAVDVQVVGGTVEGERSGHTGSGGEWGHAVSVNGSSRVRIDGVTAKEAWGDGFSIGASSSSVTVCAVVADHNRRQGLTVTSATGVVVEDSTFTRTQGTAPEAGIDVEPNPGEHVKDILITRNHLSGNAGTGIQFGAQYAARATSSVTQGRLVANVITGNGDLSPHQPAYGILLSTSSGNVAQGNTVTNQHGIGIAVLYSTGVTVRGNTVTGTRKGGTFAEAGAGIQLEEDSGTTCTGNTLRGNAGPAIFQYASTSTPTGNTIG